MATNREFIKQHYFDKTTANILKLCKQCEFEHKCELLPVTTKGEDCPYYHYCMDPAKRDPFSQ